LINGRKAMGINQQAFFEIGKPLDAVVVSDRHPLIESTNAKNRSNTIVYSADSSMFKGTLVNGQWAISDGIHKNNNIHANFVKTMQELKVR
jgi:formimidoylglutamate deiminase